MQTPAGQTSVTLNDGNAIPQIGFGVFTIPEGKETYDAVAAALETGYRHIDTAHAYNNERDVGQAVRDSGIPRDQVWITSKLWPSEYGEGKTAVGIDKMLERLGTDYIDLLLLHQEFSDYLGAWKDMERAVSAGKVHSIGLSNFEDDRLEEVIAQANIKPAILQVECHPYNQQVDVRKRIAEFGGRLEAWFPLGHGDSGLLNDPAIEKIAQAHDKSTAQVILRWHIQEGITVFPRATKPEHLRANIDIFDFELSDDEMATMRGLDRREPFFKMSREEHEKLLKQFELKD